jgi:dephospho-CoA kinase
MSRSRAAVIGVTGRIGSGKSTLCAILARRHGCGIVDADSLGHEALDDPLVKEALRRRFGAEIEGDRGKILRARLAGAVFGAPEALRDLNAIVHPWIVARARERLGALRAADLVGIVLLDAALLLDWKHELPCDGVAVVVCEPSQAIARLVARGIDEEEARRRLAAQRSEEELVREADWIVENSGDLANLEWEAERLWRAILIRTED